MTMMKFLEKLAEGKKDQLSQMDELLEIILQVRGKMNRSSKLSRLFEVQTRLVRPLDGPRKEELAQLSEWAFQKLDWYVQRAYPTWTARFKARDRCLEAGLKKHRAEKMDKHRREISVIASKTQNIQDRLQGIKRKLVCDEESPVSKTTRIELEDIGKEMESQLAALNELLKDQASPPEVVQSNAQNS